jgi:hypothetical protein
MPTLIEKILARAGGQPNLVNYMINKARPSDAILGAVSWRGNLGDANTLILEGLLKVRGVVPATLANNAVSYAWRAPGEPDLRFHVLIQRLNSGPVVRFFASFWDVEPKDGEA